MTSIENGIVTETLNGRDIDVHYIEGVRYLNMTNAADYVGCGRTWFSTKVHTLENRYTKMRYTFPERDGVYVKIEDLDTYFLTPEEEPNGTVA